MEFTEPMATFEETLAFANAVREAGGGNPLDALMPAVPQDSYQCLVAKNLNFNCRVRHTHEDNEFTFGHESWVMELDNEEIRDRIADALDLKRANRVAEIGYPSETKVIYSVRLPDPIREVAQRFDATHDLLRNLHDRSRLVSGSGLGTLVQQDIDRVLKSLGKEGAEEMLPYIEASVRETYQNADIINDDGSIVI